MAHDKAIRLHGVQVVGRVEKRFTFFEARGFGLKIHGVRAKTRSGGAETQPRARGVFKKSQYNGFAPQRGKFFQGIALNLLERLGLIKNEGDFVRSERFERQQITEAGVHIYTHPKLGRISEREEEPRLS